MARGNRNGLSTKVSGEVIRRLAYVRALWLTIHNTPNLTVEDVAMEFFYAVGELLEGKTLAQIEFRKIDRKRVLQHLKEG